MATSRIQHDFDCGEAALWQVPRIAEAADAGAIWLTLRPQSGAKPTRPPSDLNAPLYNSTKGG